VSGVIVISYTGTLVSSSTVNGQYGTVTGASGGLTNTAVISLTVTLTSTLPPGWLDVDVGSVGVAGSASYANGTFTVKASGQYIWNNADGMHFVYQPLSGDGTILARVVSLQGGASSQTAGVMIREALTAGSTHAYTTYGGSSSMYLVYRTSTGGSTLAQNSGVVTLPYWVKVVRSGNIFRGYSSPDGVNWTQVGSNQTINMGANVYIGLAVSSNNNSALATATFDNVSVN